MKTTHLAAAALLLLTAACSVSPSNDGNESAAGDTTTTPGAVLRYDIGGGHTRFDVTASADEYLRNGETITLSVGADQILSIYDQAFWNGASIDGQARLTRGGATVGTVPVSFAHGFGPNSDPLFRVATSEPLVIPAGADSIAFELTLHYQPDPAHGVYNNEAPLQTAPLTVIGAYAPNKLALFDTNGAALRARVLEGGDLAAGAQLTVAYTDYRAETILDADHIDTSVAQAEQIIDRGGDYGSPQPINGTLEYEVSVGLYDDVRGWMPEVPLTENQNPELLVQTDNPRFDFTHTADVPASATKVQCYFHVKAFLVAPASYYGKVTSQRFAPGSRSLVAETFDSQNGANYGFTAAPRESAR